MTVLRIYWNLKKKKKGLKRKRKEKKKVLKFKIFLKIQVWRDFDTKKINKKEEKVNELLISFKKI